MQEIRAWYPLESSPEVFTSMARAWGLPERYSFVDVLGLDPELLSLVPRPVHAIVLLFPDTPDIVKRRTEEGPCAPVEPGDEPLWIPQVGVGHSCGTFAMIHAFAQLGLAPKLDHFFAACRATTAPERTRLFAECDLIRDAHNGSVTAGQTVLRDTDWDDADHFLSFVQVEVDGETRLFELDGNAPRTGPLDRGRSTDLLQDTAGVIRDTYLPGAGDSVHFSVMALVG
ncbi:ubiquitinyl hydrolase 1 [Saitozyma podzolica]|uniref:Ubiquitin carboxyl-terminal hydrolase n=1 Tax=Saitozyma podzolica TaxID=1890683 RepID=A0A427XLH0_9TREE|nr:ubiquitinyl hydrolase 1 [Saitozyma podzolica]